MSTQREGKMPSQSPIPYKEAPLTYLFIDAFKELLNGRRIRRLAWVEPGEFCMMLDGWVSIYRFGKYHHWEISQGDIDADDWIVLA